MAGELDPGMGDDDGADNVKAGGRGGGKTGMRMTWNGPGHDLDVLL
jgi:hypothetical protein